MQNKAIAKLISRIDSIGGQAETEQAEYVTPEGDVVTEQAVTEAALATGPQMRYDPVLGMVPADLEEHEAEEFVAAHAQVESAPDTEAGDSEAELRERIIEDQLSSPEGREGVANWQREQERRERERRAREEALDHAAEVRAYIGSYLVLPPAQRDVILDTLTLWTIHSYSIRAAGVTPYLFVVAATQGAGKSRVLEVLSTLVNNPSAVEVNPTAPVVRLLASEGRTMFLDEIDTLAKDQSFVAVCNSGYRAGGSVTRVARAKGGQYADKTSTFCAKAFAGIAREGSLNLPSATLDRGITIRIVRATAEEMRQTKRFRADIMRDDSETVALRDWAQTWSHLHYRELRDNWVEVPELSTSRATEVWEALVSVAEALGGDWAERARAAALALDSDREQATDPNAALIQDVREVLTTWMEQNPGTRNIPVELLVTMRNELDGRQLAEKINPISFGKRLGSFGIKSTPVAKVRVYRVRDEAGELLLVWRDLFTRF